MNARKHLAITAAGAALAAGLAPTGTAPAQAGSPSAGTVSPRGATAHAVSSTVTPNSRASYRLWTQRG